jgi:RNA polymerase sigma-70 factor (ECF subfamily)
VPLRLAAQPLEDDATLVARFCAGERAVFDVLYHRHAACVAGIAYRLLSDRAVVTDVVQETFLAALESIDRLRRPEAFRTWLVGIALRRVRRRLYQQSRRALLGRIFSAGAPAASDPETRAPADELRRALATIDPKFRLPWILHHVEGETLPAVAEMEGISLATVKRRIAEADEQIRRLSR